MEDEIPNLETSDAEVIEHQAQALLVKELNEMSINERNKVFQDVHGVADFIEETEEFVNSKLEFLENELSNINTDNEAYMEAKRQSLEYVSNKKFRLKFLRGFNFDEKAAANGIVQFFEQKRILFGSGSLAHDICLSHMNESDIECIKCGYCQILSCRDRSGRAIIFFNAPLRGDRSRMSVLRAFFYFFMAAADDESNQKRGVVVVGFNIGKNKVFDLTLTVQLGKLTQALPVRLTAFHVCTEPSLLKLLSPLIKLAVAKDVRQRIREHYGTFKDCILELQSYGIPHVILPIDMDGNNDNIRVIEWCETRMLMEKATQRRNTTNSPTESMIADMGCSTEEEESSSDDTTLPGDVPSFASGQDSPQINNDNGLARKKSVKRKYKDGENRSIVITPGYYDVLFGRGKAIITHPGNLRFHQILDMHESQYESSSKTEKGGVVADILQAVWDSSGRFLKQSGKNGSWVEVSAQEARGKISQGYRTRRSSILAGVDLGAQREAAMATLGMERLIPKSSNVNVEVNEELPSKRCRR